MGGSGLWSWAVVVGLGSGRGWDWICQVQDWQLVCDGVELREAGSAGYVSTDAGRQTRRQSPGAVAASGRVTQTYRTQR